MIVKTVLACAVVVALAPVGLAEPSTNDAGKAPAEAPIQFETPAMPANPPANWLTYHLLHPGPGGAMPGDPNCAFYWKGLYHLHYIYNHKDGFAFAHVSSKDLVHWTWHPTTLFPKTTGHGMFSGTGFITKDGKPAIIYHGEGSYPANLGIPKGEDISCANMFKIGNRWMLLCISHGLGCRYYLGDFKDEKYLPEFHAMMSWNGNHYFAPESVLTQDGRRVMWVNTNKPMQPAGIRKPNAWGLHDMHGSQMEGCFDRCDAMFYEKSPVEDPFNPP